MTPRYFQIAAATAHVCAVSKFLSTFLRLFSNSRNLLQAPQKTIFAWDVARDAHWGSASVRAQ